MGERSPTSPLTERARIAHDGFDGTRPQKIAALRDHDVFLDTLRVCWENRGGAYNCGGCAKCLRTMAELRLNGVLERCRTFSEPFDMEALRGLEIRDGDLLAFYEDTLDLARERGDRQLELALEDLIRRCRAALVQ